MNKQTLFIQILFWVVAAPSQSAMARSWFEQPNELIADEYVLSTLSAPTEGSNLTWQVRKGTSKGQIKKKNDRKSAKLSAMLHESSAKKQFDSAKAPKEEVQVTVIPPGAQILNDGSSLSGKGSGYEKTAYISHSEKDPLRMTIQEEELTAVEKEAIDDAYDKIKVARDKGKPETRKEIVASAEKKKIKKRSKKQKRKLLSKKKKTNSKKRRVKRNKTKQDQLIASIYPSKAKSKSKKRRIKRRQRTRKASAVSLEAIFARKLAN